MILQNLPSECRIVSKIAKLGQINQIKVLPQRDDHLIYRLKSSNGYFVLKYFNHAIPPKEPNENERRLDEVLSILYGLRIASTRNVFPTWGNRFSMVIWKEKHSLP